MSVLNESDYSEINADNYRNWIKKSTYLWPVAIIAECKYSLLQMTGYSNISKNKLCYTRELYQEDLAGKN